MFVNTLTPDVKYSRRNMYIFWQQSQTLLSQEKKTFCGFFIAFPKYAWNLHEISYIVKKKKSNLG